MPNQKLKRQSNDTVKRVTRAILDESDAVSVAAPPGAGKTRLVTEVVDAATKRAIPTVVIANNNDQAHQLVMRTATRSPSAQVAFPVSSARRGDVPAGVSSLPNVVIPSGGAATRTALNDASVTVCTADKAGFLFSTNPNLRGGYSLETDLLIVDEAFQLPWSKFQRTNRRFARVLFVGDPGQLDPFSSVTLPASWRVPSTDHPLDPAPIGWAASGHAADTDALPATFRLPPTAAPLIARAFYPMLPFDSVATVGDRRLVFDKRGVGSASDALDHAAGEGWTFRQLPSGRVTQADPAVVDAITDLVATLFSRRPRTVDEEGDRPLEQHRVAVGVSHRDQRHAVAAALALRGLGEVPVHTANTIQGLEYDVTFVWHPLSGQAAASSFHVDAGRMCVLLSRHRHACVVVGRAGIDAMLDSYPPPGEHICDGRPNPELSGWEAHEAVLSHLLTLAA